VLVKIGQIKFGHSFQGPDSHILQVEMSGFSKEDIKNFKYHKITEDDEFYLVIEATKNLRKPE